MNQTENIPKSGFRISEKDPGALVIHLSGCININTCSTLMSSLSEVIANRQPSRITFDLAEVSRIDDYGAFLLFETGRPVRGRQGECTVVNADKNTETLLSLVGFYSQYINSRNEPPKDKEHYLVRLGATIIDLALNLRFMISFIGSVIISIGKVIVQPRSLRVEDMIVYMKQTGVDALPVVGMISFLLGLIIAFMSSIQFKQFGANIYVASLVAFSMVSELGPIMTAIVVAGRSGSAYAAEIGTMKVSEEVDALFAMGFNPTVFLVVPRIFSAVIVIPILTIFADISAISGGLLIGVFMLDLSPNTYMTETLNILTIQDFLWGGLKSLVFSVLIAMIGCLRGFRASGGASSVGNAATSAVVASIFMIIFFDSIFAVMRSYW